MKETEKMLHVPLDIATFEQKASEVALLLKTLANRRRLMLLCKLVEHGELSVGQLADEIGLSQSALSQHLALLRAEGLVAFEREAQTLRYRIADPRVEALLGHLYQIYCAKDGANGGTE